MQFTVMRRWLEYIKRIHSNNLRILFPKYSNNWHQKTRLLIHFVTNHFCTTKIHFYFSPQWNHICLNPAYPSLDSHYRNLTTLIAFTSTWTIILSLNCCGHKDKSWYAGFSLKNSNSWGKPWTRSYLSDTNLLPQNAGHWCDRLGISA